MRQLKLLAVAATVAGVALGAAPVARADDGLVVNQALGGTVQPASAAKLIDGSAGIAWCPSGHALPSIGIFQDPTRAD